MWVAQEKQVTRVEELPLIPLRGMLVFPHTVTPLDVGRTRSIKALEEAMIRERTVILASQRHVEEAEPEPADIYRIGTVAEVKQLLKMPEGQLRVLVEGVSRGRILDFLHEEPFYKVRAYALEPDVIKTREVEALMRTAVTKFEQYVKLSRSMPGEILATVNTVEGPSRLADTIASQMILPVEKKQLVLESIDVEERLQLLCTLLTKEMDIMQLEKKIHLRVRKQIEKSQKEYYLREQIKAIEKELGEDQDSNPEIREYRQKIAEAQMPDEAEKKALYELERLYKMPPMVAEATVIRNYLDWLVAIPWSFKTEDRLDLDYAAKVLDEDHFGLETVKERILEFLAVRHLTGKVKGPILCLAGPPGVGKTSLGKSIARAMGRRFHRFSLGGVRDEAEIRGHRRTYVGAMPGKIIQVMRRVEAVNPVVLLDEVDKMTSDFRGDPASALLEVLDSEQNDTFQDHYLEVPYDLSEVLFITTANVLSDIPPALRDRMEIIEIPGYTEYEKLEIAKRHLVPKQMAIHGIKKKQLGFSDAAISKIINGYTRESGVRSLERQIASLCRKTAKEFVQSGKKQISISMRNLEKYLGSPQYYEWQGEKEDRIGLVNGLAYTQYGGDVLSIEVVVVPGKGKLVLTGKLGDVMKESAQAAFSYVRSKAVELSIPPNFYEDYDIHVHVPEGAIPKDGPSAGITIAVALASALTGRYVHRDVAMTGELTLRGRVLPIGGLKEKLLAAQRAGMRKVIIPEANKKDLEEIPDLIKEKLEIITVKHMDRVLDVALVPKALEEDLPSEDAIEYLPAVERKTWPDAVHGSTQ